MSWIIVTNCGSVEMWKHVLAPLVPHLTPADKFWKCGNLDIWETLSFPEKCYKVINVEG